MYQHTFGDDLYKEVKHNKTKQIWKITPKSSQPQYKCHQNIQSCSRNMADLWLTLCIREFMKNNNRHYEMFKETNLVPVKRFVHPK